MKKFLLLIFLSVFFSQANSASMVKSFNGPGEFSLSQNYPNPFNPVTSISFSIPEDSFVSIKVYNLLGNQVATVINKEIEAGQHSIKFDASSLPSGVYFYMLKADNNVATKKLVLLK
jgi:hypothetical protein